MADGSWSTLSKYPLEANEQLWKVGNGVAWLQIFMTIGIIELVTEVAIKPHYMTTNGCVAPLLCPVLLLLLLRRCAPCCCCCFCFCPRLLSHVNRGALSQTLTLSSPPPPLSSPATLTSSDSRRPPPPASASAATSRRPRPPSSRTAASP